MKKYNRKLAYIAVLAIIFAFGTVFAASALAWENTLFDDSTNQALSGNTKSKPVTQASVPCDPAQTQKGGLSFLP